MAAASRADLPAVLEIERLSFVDPWPESAFRSELNHGWSWFRVARLPAGESGEPVAVGYIVCWLVPGDMHLLNLAVHPRHRGQGIASLLLHEALDHFASRGGGQVYLEVRPSNQAARKVYSRAGFMEVGRRPGYYRRLREDALVMALRVGEKLEHEAGT